MRRPKPPPDLDGSPGSNASGPAAEATNAPASRFTPSQFEQFVFESLTQRGVKLSAFSLTRLERIVGVDGTYEIDITARFELFNASFLVLIECKRYREPIKRQIVQVLHDKVRATGAHKGMLFATAPFQPAALTYAQSHGIALIEVRTGGLFFRTRGQPQSPKAPGPIAFVHSLSRQGRVTAQPLDTVMIDALLGSIGTTG
jgi:restriction system protein